MFQVGQKVVCVDPGFFTAFLTRGAIYTVSSVSVEWGEDWIGCAETYGGKEGWRARRFRPLDEHKTDISIFTAMLTPKKKRAPVRIHS